MNSKQTPFLMSKADDEVAAIIGKSSVFLAKRAFHNRNNSLSYLYAPKQLSSIGSEKSLAFLQRQYKVKSVEVQTAISLIECDKLIEKQLLLKSSVKVLLIKRTYVKKEVVLAFERIYVNLNDGEYVIE